MSAAGTPNISNGLHPYGAVLSASSASKSHSQHYNSYDVGSGALDMRSVLMAVANAHKVYFAVNFFESFN